MSEKKFLRFPKDFIWGTSTAAAQVETAHDHNWKGVPSKDGYIFDRTTDHELRRDEDLENICQFGSMYRCGVDWSRLQTKAFAPFDEEVIEEYQVFFELLNKRGMKIMFVMHHFMNPTWYEENGSWLNRDNIPAFTDYVKQCIEHFGEYVYTWNTFNEPNVYALNGWVMGAFPPFKKNILKASRAIKNMGHAHDIAYDLIKQRYPKHEVGISFNTVHFDGLNFLGKLIAKFTDWWFIDFCADKFKNLDYWGLSYYAYIPFKPMAITEIDQPGKLAEMGLPHDKMWGYRPESFRTIINRFYKKFKKPIIITENGVCTDDSQVRIDSINDYLKILHELIAEGVPIKAYTHWSTWDNFEWNLGPTYRFGLVRVDFETMERTMTDAGRYYSKVTSENGIEI